MKRLLFAVFITSLMVISGRSDAQTTGRVFWKGMVDAKVQLSIKGDKIETKTLAGKEYPDGVYSFTSPLPDEPVKVGLNKTDGRGKAAVIQQPNDQNNYTAIVEVTDDKGGAREYRLEIFWQ
jgi:hypothetical protein